MATWSMCLCDARLHAQLNGELIFLPSRKAWCFTRGERRTMSAKARYMAFAERSEYKHRDHTGEPITLECCPWCGHDLPGVPVMAQADGDQGEGVE